MRSGQVHISCVYFNEAGRWAGAGWGWFDAVQFTGCLGAQAHGERLLALATLPNVPNGLWRHPFTCEVDYDKPELVLP